LAKWGGDLAGAGALVMAGGLEILFWRHFSRIRDRNQAEELEAEAEAFLLPGIRL